MKARFLTFFIILLSFSHAFSQSYQEIARRTARQTWWYFSLRLANPLPSQHHFRVFLEKKGTWLMDIKQLPNGKYEGIADTTMRDCPAGTIEFDSTEIDDWLLMTNKILVGGFLIRTQEKPKWEMAQSALRFQLTNAAVTEDFIKESQISKGNGNSISHFEDSLLKARFPGGTTGFYGHINREIYYPDFAQQSEIEGYTTISFVLNGDGTISHYTIVRGIGGGTHELVTEIFDSLADQWIPAPDEKKAPSVKLMLPFAFKLQ